MKYKKIRNNYICNCKCGHVFDFKEAIPYDTSNPNKHPGLLKCPYCKRNNWSFVGNGINLYPIKFNYDKQTNI